MNLEICIGTGISVKGVKVRCIWNDCRGNEKKIANCSEQASQTENFGIAEMWDVEFKVLQEYFKVNYRAVLFSLIAFWYFFIVFVPYLTTGKLGELQFGLNGYRKNYEYDLGCECIDKYKDLEEYTRKLNGDKMGEHVNVNSKNDENWRYNNPSTGIEKIKTNFEYNESEEMRKRLKDRSSEEIKNVILKETEEIKIVIQKETEEITNNIKKKTEEIIYKEEFYGKIDLNHNLKSQINDIESAFYRFNSILSLAQSAKLAWIMILLQSN